MTAPDTEPQLCDGVPHYAMLLKVGHYFKRTIYFEFEKERDYWVKIARLAQGEEGRNISDEYTLTKEVLGKGSFGQVVKGISKTKKEEVAIKILIKKGMKMGELEMQMNEISIMRALNSPHVVAILDVFEDMEHLYIVQELI